MTGRGRQKERTPYLVSGNSFFSDGLAVGREAVRRNLAGGRLPGASFASGATNKIAGVCPTSKSHPGRAAQILKVRRGYTY